VLDHMAKPRIGENLREPWNTYMSQLAERATDSKRTSSSAPLKGPRPFP
jgi:predicted TIM-barrel fold metal-dependent hydrolase